MSIEAMKLAVENMEWSTPQGREAYWGLVKAIAEAEKQEQSKPVAWMSEENGHIFFDADKPNPMDYDFWTPLYTTLPQRTWVGLADEEIFKIHKQVDSMQYLTFGKAIEAKLKEKNS